MKTKLLTLLMLAFISWSVNAQTTLWGTSFSGGTNGQGTIFTADASGANFHTVYNFVNATGANPWGRMCVANNGALYGCSDMGGFGDSCVCFRYDINTGTYTNIFNLYQNTLLGWEAETGMMSAADGNLYGTCALGGANGGGALFKIDISTDTYTDLFDFANANGSAPYGGLIQLSDGKLYGTTYSGGANNVGVIFSFDPATSIYTKLYVFDGTNGSNPQLGSLMQGTDGKLYGMTTTGGTTSDGVIFSFDLTTGNFVNLYSFDFTHGATPYGGLIQAANGTLYGMASAGGSGSLGVLFSFNPATNGYTDLLDFNGTNGASPQRSLTIGSTGLLLGTTNGGGLTSEGVAFSFDVNTNTYTKLADFSAATTGSNPNAEINLGPPPATVGIAALNGAPAISIFPNPATNFITITNTNKDEVIDFTDVLGRNIATIKTSALSKTTVDVSGYPNVFFVRTTNGEVQKIVKK